MHVFWGEEEGEKVGRKEGVGLSVCTANTIVAASREGAGRTALMYCSSIVYNKYRVRVLERATSKTYGVVTRPNKAQQEKSLYRTLHTASYVEQQRA